MRRAIIQMAKYTTTSMEFFFTLPWLEGLVFFSDIVEMSEEESKAADGKAEWQDPAQGLR